MVKCDKCDKLATFNIQRNWTTFEVEHDEKGLTNGLSMKLNGTI